jgi:hypothetical protein
VSEVLWGLVLLLLGLVGLVGAGIKSLRQRVNPLTHIGALFFPACIVLGTVLVVVGLASG